MFGPAPHIIGALLQLIPAATNVYNKVAAAEADGKITPDEAAEIGATVAGELGDLRVVVRGRDILGPKAQEDILRGLGRVGLQLHRALTA